MLTEDEAGPNAFIMRGQYMDSLSTALKQKWCATTGLSGNWATLFDIQRAIREVLMSAERMNSTQP